MLKILNITILMIAIVGCNEVNAVENKIEVITSEEKSIEKSIKFSKNVFSPESGVICDSKSQFCSDSHGISLGFTKEYLGEEASNIWSKRLTKDFDSTIFTMSDGIFCDTNQKICKKSKWDDSTDKSITQRIFNEK